MANKKFEKRGLGRGLSALMADVDMNNESASADQSTSNSNMSVPIEKVRPNPGQPRTDFESSDLDELAASIKEKGIIQPLIVRQDPEDESLYQIVAGERRWRAAQIATLHEVPVVVREFDDGEVLEIAIIENIQRSDLNPVEEALGYRHLQEKFGHTQDQMSTALGKSRSHIANVMRLLKLPDEVLAWLREGKLSAGHARALISLDEPTEIARHVIQRNLSVRETERLVKQSTSPKPSQEKRELKSNKKDADTLALEADLSAALGLKVHVDHKEDSETGVLSISYKNFDQLDDLCRRLAQSEQF